MSLRWMGFKHFRTRILVFVLSLLILVQTTIFLAVNVVNTRNAINQIDQALQLTQDLFLEALDARKKRLLEKIRLLSSDYAFKKTFASSDIETILSVLENHQARVNADVMMLLNFETGNIIASTLKTRDDETPANTATNNDQRFLFSDLLEQAYENEHGESSGIRIFNNQPYQFVLVPLFTPEPTAWIVIAYAVEDRFAKQLQDATQTHVSIIGHRSKSSASIFASTLPQAERDAIEESWPQWLSSQFNDLGQASSMDLRGEPYVSLIVPIDSNDSVTLNALLQRPLNKALEAYLGIRTALLAVFMFALIVSIIGVMFIARSVTRPVRALVSSAKKIEQGDYANPVVIRQRDELGRLAHSFNQMMKGLAERRQVRSLLGKVVSPEIADELLKKDIELGGEERKVSILFSDVRNFTSLCEGRAPKEILTLLNRYLTRVSDVIETHQGVIDKYIGDAVMALFGAPIQRQDDEYRAVRAAMNMCTALDDINRELAEARKPLLAVGVGINTDVVVAGNMGSNARLNYTVIGDGVNLASRLEGLTKHYGVSIIVSEATQKACPTLLFRELDKVRVKGKSEPVIIYEPLSLVDEAEQEVNQELQQYHTALNAYRQRKWPEALSRFKQLCDQNPTTMLYQVYCQRTSQHIAQAPADDWDGTFTFDTK